MCKLRLFDLLVGRNDHGEESADSSEGDQHREYAEREQLVVLKVSDGDAGHRVDYRQSTGRTEHRPDKDQHASLTLPRVLDDR